MPLKDRNEQMLCQVQLHREWKISYIIPLFAETKSKLQIEYEKKKYLKNTNQQELQKKKNIFIFFCENAKAVVQLQIDI